MADRTGGGDGGDRGLKALQGASLPVSQRRGEGSMMIYDIIKIDSQMIFIRLLEPYIRPKSQSDESLFLPAAEQAASSDPLTESLVSRVRACLLLMFEIFILLLFNSYYYVGGERGERFSISAGCLLCGAGVFAQPWWTGGLVSWISLV